MFRQKIIMVAQIVIPVIRKDHMAYFWEMFSARCRLRTKTVTRDQAKVVK